MTRSSTITIAAFIFVPALAGCAATPNLAVEYRPASSSGSTAPKGSFLARGQAQLAAGVTSLAIESFRSEIRKSPDNGDAYNGLAIAYDRIGRTDLAQRYFETAMAKAPSEPRFRSNLAQLFERTGQEQMASNLHAASNLAIAAVPGEAVSAELAVTGIIAQPTGAEDAMLVMQADEAPLIAKMDAAENNASAPEMTKRTASIEPVPEYLDDKGLLDIAFTLPQSSMNEVKLITGAGISLLPLGPNPERAPARRDDALAASRSEERRGNIRIERISLGEVRITTLENLEPKQADAADFAAFDRRLASWLPQAIALEESVNDRGDSLGTSLLAAVERAEIERAFTVLDTHGGGITLPELDLPGYVFFPDASTGTI